MGAQDKTKEATKDVAVATKVKDADGKPKKAAPPKPNEAVFEERIAEVMKKIEAKNDEMKKVQEVINKRSEGKESYEEKRSALYDRMNAIKAERGALAEQRKALRENERALKDKARTAERGLKDLMRATETMNEDTLNEKIYAIDYKLTTSSMSLKEEKGLLMEMKKLKALKPQAQKISRELEAAKAQSMVGGEGGESGSADQMGSLTEQIQKLERESDEQWDAINKLKEERKKQTSGVEGEIEKKTKIKGDIDGFYDEKKKIVSELKGAKDAWYQFQKAEREERNRKWLEEKKKADFEWEAERAKRELEQPNPFLDEITLLQQTIDYCKNLMPKEEGAAEEKKEVAHNAPEGAKIMISKKDRDAEMYFAPTKKKALKKKGDKAATKSIKHTADTFAVFDQLKLAAPMSLADVPEVLSKMEASLDAINDKVKDWEEERKKKCEAALEAIEKGETSEEFVKVEAPEEKK